MSKPETPCLCGFGTFRKTHADNCPKAEAPQCLPGCREEATYPSNGIGWRNSDGVRKIHVSACPNAPKAEAPPAPVYIDGNRVCPCGNPACEGTHPRHFFDAKPAPHANVSEPIPPPWHISALITERDALKAQNAALQEAHDHAQTGLKSARKQEGEMREKIAALTAELERLRDLIVQAREWRFSEADTAWSLVIEARAIHSARAAREAGKA